MDDLTTNTASNARTVEVSESRHTIPFPVNSEADRKQASSPSVHDHLPHIFAVSAGLMGVSLSGIGLFAIHSQMRSAASIAEELLAFNATIFGASCGAAYLGMRAGKPRAKQLIHWFSEGFLLLGLLSACSWPSLFLDVLLSIRNRVWHLLWAVGRSRIMIIIMSRIAQLPGKPRTAKGR